MKNRLAVLVRKMMKDRTVSGPNFITRLGIDDQVCVCNGYELLFLSEPPEGHDVEEERGLDLITKHHDKVMEYCRESILWRVETPTMKELTEAIKAMADVDDKNRIIWSDGRVTLGAVSLASAMRGLATEKVFYIDPKESGLEPMVMLRDASDEDIWMVILQRKNDGGRIGIWEDNRRWA